MESATNHVHGDRDPDGQDCVADDRSDNGRDNESQGNHGNQDEEPRSPKASSARKKERRRSEPRGVLRGLDPDVIITSSRTCRKTEEGSDEEGRSEKLSARATRSARKGQTPVSYDQKYHPMDEIMRPKRAAKRRSGNDRPVSPKSGTSSGTEAETIPSSGSAQSRDDSSGHSSSGRETGNPHEHVGRPSIRGSQREPDPKAVRHSARSTAQKVVLYDTHSHPQDQSIAGFKGRAKRKRAEMMENLSMSASPRPRTQPQRPSPVEAKPVSKRGNGKGRAQLATERRTPRKNLKSLSKAKVIVISDDPEGQQSTEESLMSNGHIDSFLQDTVGSSEHSGELTEDDEDPSADLDELDRTISHESEDDEPQRHRNDKKASQRASSESITSSYRRSSYVDRGTQMVEADVEPHRIAPSSSITVCERKPSTQSNLRTVSSSTRTSSQKDLLINSHFEREFSITEPSSHTLVEDGLECSRTRDEPVHDDSGGGATTCEDTTLDVRSTHEAVDQCSQLNSLSDADAWKEFA